MFLLELKCFGQRIDKKRKEGMVERLGGMRKGRREMIEKGRMERIEKRIRERIEIEREKKET